MEFTSITINMARCQAVPVSVMLGQWDSPLSILPVARAMIGQWDSSLSVLPVARGYDRSVG